MRFTLLACVVALCVLSGAAFAQGTMVILTSDNIGDSAVADAVKNAKGVEVFTTAWGEFDQSVVDSIIAAGAENVIIIGGPAAVLADYETALSEYTITRIAGATREETSGEVLKHFKNEFKNRKVVLAHGYDPEGIKSALQRAKEHGGIVLFVGKDRVSDEVGEAINETETEDVDMVAAPNMNKTKIKEKIWERTQARINETVEENVKERAELRITKTAELLEEMEAGIAELEVGRGAIGTLAEKTREHLRLANEAFEAEKYGEAFGHAVAAGSKAENTMRLAKKVNALEGKGKDVTEVTRKIKSATLEWRKLVRIMNRLSAETDVSEVLEEAEAKLEAAQSSADESDSASAMTYLDEANGLLSQVRVQLKTTQREMAALSEEEVADETLGEESEGNQTQKQNGKAE